MGIHHNKINTVLIDDEARALNRLAWLLESLEDINIIGRFQDADKGLRFILEHNPLLAFIDIEMPGYSGLDILSELNVQGLSTKVVFVTGHPEYTINAIRGKAFDYLLKPVSLTDLKSCVQRLDFQDYQALSQREREVVRLLAQGLTSREIAEILFLSRHTVDTHRRKILQKTGVNNTVELVQFVKKNGIA